MRRASHDDVTVSSNRFTETRIRSNTRSAISNASIGEVIHGLNLEFGPHLAIRIILDKKACGDQNR